MAENDETTCTGSIETTVPAFENDLDPIEAGSFIKHYEIIRRLGAGGTGKVFLARDTRIGRLVAIKLVTLATELAQRNRLLAEARATARCKHENIVVIYEVDVYDALPYMVLEYVEGMTLRAWMHRRAGMANTLQCQPGGEHVRVSPALCVEMMLSVARALVCAHAQGIVHRDLKPENILVGDDGSIKVVDFGIAMPVTEHESQLEIFDTVRGINGTPPYMSPEALRNEVIDHRTDIWALGVIFFELAVGRHPLAPFSRNRLPEVMDLETPLPSARALCPQLETLGELVDRCLDKRQDRRVESARDLVAELSMLRTNVGSRPLVETETPFAGLLAFQEVDQGKFFGRDGDIAHANARLRFQPLVAIGGPSGGGKSSFVRAGLIPTYKRLGEGRNAILLRPGRKPLLALGNALAELGDGALENLAFFVPDLRADPEMLAKILRERPGFLGW